MVPDPINAPDQSCSAFGIEDIVHLLFSLAYHPALHDQVRESGLQRLECYIRGSQHDLQQGGGGTSRIAAMLFPILQGLNADLHQLSKFVL